MVLKDVYVRVSDCQRMFGHNYKLISVAGMLKIMNHISYKNAKYIKIRKLVFNASYCYEIMHSLQGICDVTSIVILVFNVMASNNLTWKVVNCFKTYLLILLKFVMPIYFIDHVLQTKVIINTLKRYSTECYLIKVFVNIISTISWWDFIFIGVHNFSVSKEFLIRIIIWKNRFWSL